MPSNARLASAATLAFMLSAISAHGQQPVVVRELSPTIVASDTYFANIFSVRPLNGGRVLVNDGIRRQLVILDERLSKPSILLDSVAVGGQGYGTRPQPLIPYLADSTLFVDGGSLSLLVIDPSGKIAHVMSAPKPNDLRNLAVSASGVDARGNLVYRGPLQIAARAAGAAAGAAPGMAPPTVQVPDSAPLLRANFDTRAVDTISKLKVQSGNRPNIGPGSNGKIALKLTINPINTVDEWAALSDGTIAMIRGHDYHVDVVTPDGKTFSAPKLPFDWKRLSDADKQALIDSARAAQDKAVADAKASATTAAAAQTAAQEAMIMQLAAQFGGGGAGAPPGTAGMAGFAGMGFGGGFGGGGGANGSTSGFPPAMMNMIGSVTVDYVPLNEIADYYPAIRPGAAKADLDGNVWVLPTTSAQSKAGELVYDVINNHGELTHRVRLPLGRLIAGFGHNGIVYLMHRDGDRGWRLERATVAAAARKTF